MNENNMEGIRVRYTSIAYGSYQQFYFNTQPKKKEQFHFTIYKYLLSSHLFSKICGLDGIYGSNGMLFHMYQRIS